MSVSDEFKSVIHFGERLFGADSDPAAAEAKHAFLVGAAREIATDVGVPGPVFDRLEPLVEGAVKVFRAKLYPPQEETADAAAAAPAAA